jgi:hypothetical protein
VSARPVPPRQIWWLLLGFTVWCLALTVLYAMHAIGCAFGWPTGALRVGLVVALLASLALLGWMWRTRTRTVPAPGTGPTGDFLQVVFLWTTAVAFVSAALVFAPPLLLTACV